MNIKVERIRFYNPAHDSTLLLTPPNIFTTVTIHHSKTCCSTSQDLLGALQRHHMAFPTSPLRLP